MSDILKLSKDLLAFPLMNYNNQFNRKLEPHKSNKNTNLIARFPSIKRLINNAIVLNSD